MKQPAACPPVRDRSVTALAADVRRLQPLNRLSRQCRTLGCLTNVFAGQGCCRRQRGVRVRQDQGVL
jgi:hypothetical protein